MGHGMTQGKNKEGGGQGGREVEEKNRKTLELEWREGKSGQGRKETEKNRKAVGMKREEYSAWGEFACYETWS